MRRMLSVTDHLLGGVALGAAIALAPAAGFAADAFERGSIMLERNATDDDLEIRIEISATSEGMSELTVMAPDGTRLLELRTAPGRMGVRHLILETPEPVLGTGLLAAYPAGTYRLEGRSGSGAALNSQARLSHQLPAPARIVSPEVDQRDVRPTGVRLQWTRVPDIIHYIVVLEHERSGTELRAQLPSAVTSMAVPDGFLTPGRTYKFAVGTVSQDGNRTFVESEFTVRQ